MPTTTVHVAEHLTRLDVAHHVDGDSVLLALATPTYRSPSGEGCLRVRVEVRDKGAFLAVVAPMAFVVEGDHGAAVFETCLRFQYLYRVVRFEFDPTDGELRLSIHVPLHDGTLGRAQFDDCLTLLVRLADRVYPFVRAAMDSGEVMPFEADRRTQRIGRVVERLADLSADELETLLAALTGDDGPEPDGVDRDAEDSVSAEVGQ